MKIGTQKGTIILTIPHVYVHICMYIQGLIMWDYVGDYVGLYGDHMGIVWDYM